MGTFIKVFTFNQFQENSYLIYDDAKNCIIIDPGCYERHEQQELVDFIAGKELNVKALLNTHAHIDHVLGNAFVIDKYKVPFYMHPLDIPTLKAVPNYAHVYGFPGYMESPMPTTELKDKEVIAIGEMTCTVLFTPGHAPGHVVFHFEREGFVINGDVLFNGSFGRVDLPGGDIEILKKSIKNTMFNLPEHTVVYCGHGPKTTIGQEKKTNYILQF
jgi:hydroxyacylglutathione hydrolase